ncbi:hypothetical protein [Plantactinospora sp. DSM 117369]
MHLNDSGRVQRVDVSHTWWRDLSPERLAEAITTAANRAVVDRIRVWSERVAERADGEPPADWQSALIRCQGADPSDCHHTGQIGVDESRVEELLRISDATNAAMSEMNDLRHRTDVRARQQVQGRSLADRVTVTLTGGQILRVDIDQRWLRKQPSGQAVASDLYEACQDAYDRIAQEDEAALGGLPGLAALRDLTVDPAALMRRLGSPG